VRFSVCAPTGELVKGKLANVGKNFWTFEPAVSLGYLSSKIGLEVTAFTGLDFNTGNDSTDYQSGDQFHLDVTIAEHLPLLGGFIGVGVNGYYYTANGYELDFLSFRSQGEILRSLTFVRDDKSPNSNRSQYTTNSLATAAPGRDS
jgi:hypothetical protein